MRLLPRRRRLAVAASVAIVSASLFVWLIGRSYPLGGLSAGIVAYRKAGLPWTAKEVEPPIPEDRNAGPLLKTAFNEMEPLFHRNRPKKLFLALERGDAKSAGAQLAAYGPGLKAVRTALARPHAEFSHDWDVAILTDGFGELGQSDDTAIILCSRALYRVRNGNLAGAIEDLQTASTLADRVGEGYISRAQIEQIKIGGEVCDAAAICATQSAGNIGALRAIATMLATVKEAPHFRDGIRGDAYVGLAELRNQGLYLSQMTDYASGPPPLNLSHLRRTGRPPGLQSFLYAGPLLNAWAKASDVIAADGDDFDRLDRDLAEIQRRATASAVTYRLLGISYENAIGYGIPVHLGLAQQDVARIRTTKALLEALLVKAATGRCPRSITDLPTKWIDPFDGKPLRLLLGKGSIRIYSVGPNMKDDGGKTQYEVHFKEDFDVVAGDPLPQYESLAVGPRKGSTKSRPK